MGAVLVSVAEYARRVGKSERTIRNWLYADEIPGAIADDRGVWSIPVDAVRNPRPLDVVKAEKATKAGAPVAPARVGVEAILASLPGMVDLDTAARLLGCTVGHLLRNRDRFEIERGGGANGQGFLVPQRVIRRIFGLIP